MEKMIDREKIYDGRVVTLVKDQVELDDGTRSFREVVLHPGAVCIAVKDDDHYLLVKQYRYAAGQELLEFPAGKLEPGEDPLEAIIRETREETGYKIKDIVCHGYIYPTCGYSSERIYLYSASTDTYAGTDFDEDERITLYRYTLPEIEELVRENKIVDGKTLSLLYHLRSNND